MRKKILSGLVLVALVAPVLNGQIKSVKTTETVAAVRNQPAEKVSNPAVEAKVEEMLGKMTTDEKLSLLGGLDEFFLPGIERLNVPKLKMGDGPVGVRNWGKSTLYPATMMLAATWNEKLASRFGTSLGRDSRARGMHISLAPGVNIYRSPLNGRNFEYMGEDPLLAGRMAVASIKAVQSQGVAATIKHFAANNSETRRSFISNDIDERTLREIYLPAFERAVKDGKVWAIMNAYNLLNGEYCTENNWLNNTVLKGEWGFQGVVMSDWHAAHSTEKAALGGLDLEMPGAEYFAPDKLKPLIESGKIPATVIDDKVRRILRMMVANGWLDKNQEDKTIPQDDPTSAATALEIAREGIVLLKNLNQLLPLDKSKTKSIVVLGPNATPIVAGLGSSKVVPFHSVGFFEGLQQQAKGISVKYIKWDEPVNYFKTATYAGKVKLDLFNGRKQSKKISSTETDSIGIEWDSKKPSMNITSKEQPLARYTAFVEPAKTGDYQFVVQAKDANVDVWVDDKKIWTSVREGKGSVALPLVAGNKHKVVVEIEQRKKDRSFKVDFGWGEKTELIPANQLEEVRNADLAVVAVGFNAITGEGEGYDRTYEMPGRQSELIKTVAQINPKTAVVLNAGGSVATADWIGNVPVMLHAFYAGQEGGTALADILLGDVNPSGKLPFSYEKKIEDIASYANYPNPDDLKPTNMKYAEGIFIGYRWFDNKKIEPLFPFGYGLSYTTFDYGKLKTTKAGDQVNVSLTVKNTGKREGAEVVQLYVGQKNPSVPRPVRELKDFAKVFLKPGETKEVTFALGKDAFAFFHPTKKQWIAEPGDFTLEAGASAADIRQTSNFIY